MTRAVRLVEVGRQDGLQNQSVAVSVATRIELIERLAATVAKAEFDVAGDFVIGHYAREKNSVTSRAALITIEIVER